MTRQLVFFGVFLVLLVANSTMAESLPVWSDEDRARLLRGELIAGADILVDDPADVPLPRVAPEPEIPPIEVVDPLPAYDPRVIPPEYLPVYFSSSPEGYLVDPQRLLSMQESLDQEGFLDYHANDSEIDIRLYLFDAQQNIPEPYTIENLCREHYDGGSLTAVVFCFLGDPTRNQIAFGGDGAAEVSATDVRKMHESAQIKAMEKSDPATQLESFIVQVSIRLFWLERERAQVRAVAAVARNGDRADAGAGSDRRAKSNAGRAGNERGAIAKGYLLPILAGAAGLLCLCGGLFLGWSTWMRQRRYHFPVMEVPERLGANYAAGVGAVIAFHSKLGSPSSQRDQFPDYLTRM